MTTPDPAEQWRRTLLRETLRLAVPRHKDGLDGLPLDVLIGIASAASATVAVHGDDLLYGGRYCAETFNAVARGLAAAALIAQGGIDYMDLHWCAIPHCRMTHRFDHADDPEPPGWPKPPEPPPPRPVDTLPDLDAYTP